MAVTNEEKRYYGLINNAPAAFVSGQTAQSGANLAAAEQAAQRSAANFDYDRTADARLDRAIGEYLNQNGYNYDIHNDQAYRDFAKEYSQNALRGAELSQSTANQLANGYDPTYAGTVASEVGNDAALGYTNYLPQYLQLMKNEAAAKRAQAGNAAQVYKSLQDTQYARDRDTQNDRQAVMEYLAGRYAADRQTDSTLANANTDIWRERLSAAADDLSTARSLDNKMYQYLSQSADSRAKIAEDNYEANQKLNYQMAKDSYDERVAAEKAAAKAAEEAAKEQAKVAEQMKKDNETNQKNLYKINNYLSGNIKSLSNNEKYALDFNKDGVIDTKDAYYAAQIAEGKMTAEDVMDTVTFENDSKVRDAITNIREQRRGGRGGSIKDIAKAWLEKHQNDLSPGQSAYLFNYFGL